MQIKILTGSPQEIKQLQQLLEAAPDFSLRTTGAPPGPREAESTLSDLPSGGNYKDKFVYGIYLDDTMIGFADLIRGYPNAETAFIGLLVFCETSQRRGLGSAAYQLIEAEVKKWGTCTKIRLAVVAANDIVLPFWKQQGFRETGERKPYKNNLVESVSILMEKNL